MHMEVQKNQLTHILETKTDHIALKLLSHSMQFCIHYLVFITHYVECLCSNITPLLVSVTMF